jgi:hypothetical protein
MKKKVKLVFLVRIILFFIFYLWITSDDVALMMCEKDDVSKTFLLYLVCLLIN